MNDVFRNWIRQSEEFNLLHPSRWWALIIIRHMRVGGEEHKLIFLMAGHNQYEMVGNNNGPLFVIALFFK